MLFVLINAKVAAQVLAFIWLGIGAIVLICYYAAGRRPALSGMTAQAGGDQL